MLPRASSPLLAALAPTDALYFVHSYRVASSPSLAEWTLCETEYGESFVSGVTRGNVSAVQFHPEKSGAAGLLLLSPAGLQRCCPDSVPDPAAARALWRALCRTDPDTGKTRGYLLLSARKPGAPWPQTSRPPTAHR